MYESSMFHGHKTSIVFIWLYSWTVLFCSSTVRQWSVHTAACVSVYSGHEAYVYSLVVIQ